MSRRKSTEYQINWHNGDGDIISCAHEDRKPAAMRAFESAKTDIGTMIGRDEVAGVSVEKVSNWHDDEDGNLEDRDWDSVAEYPANVFAAWTD